MRFLDKILVAVRGTRPSIVRTLDREQKTAYYHDKVLLEDPNTKRILFDSRQAALFDAIDETVPYEFHKKLHWPFPQFYLEFTEPILTSNQEPEQQDYLRAILVDDTNAVEAIMEINGQRISFRGTIVTFFYDNPKGDFVDRTWFYDLRSGEAFTRWLITQENADPSRISGLTLKSNDFVMAGRMGAEEGRYVGWWERQMISSSQLLAWIMSYLMAKSIRIEAEDISRQQRRWHERNGLIPKPWHYVKLDPKIVMAHGYQEEGLGIHHRYRYDVIGHLRFGRHKRGDGTYSHTVEWIAPHQRGLTNTVYIPKTYRVDKDKSISQRYKEYLQS
jgi:hypothetical protein